MLVNISQDRKELDMQSPVIIHPPILPKKPESKVSFLENFKIYETSQIFLSPLKLSSQK